MADITSGFETDPLPYRVTHQYTTGNISGTVPGPARYFRSEERALDYYRRLRFGTREEAGIPTDENVDKRSVKLSVTIGWRELLPGSGVES